MVNVKAKKCLSISCNKRAVKRKFCNECYNLLNIIEPLDNTRIKERAVVEYIINSLPEYTWHHNKAITKYNFRPDMMLKLENKIILIEVDEHQHCCYLGRRERQRINLIARAYDDKKIIIIRFNPDEYSNKENINILSCWYHNKEKNILEIREDELRERMRVLKDTIIKYIVTDYDATLTTVKLFYNCARQNLKTNLNSKFELANFENKSENKI